MRHVLQRLVGRSFAAILLRGATLVTGVLSVTLVAPYLGSADLGNYAVLQSMIAWSGLAALGLPEACSGILGKFHRTGALSIAKRYLDSSFVIACGSAGALGSVCLLMGSALWWRGHLATQELLVFGLGVGLALVAIPFGIVQSTLNAEGEIERSTGWSFMTSALVVVVIWVVVHFLLIPQGHRLLAVTMAIGLATLAVRVVMHAVESRRVYGTVENDIRLSKRRTEALLASAYPFVIINLAALAAFQIDRFVAYHYLSPGETAKLDVTMRILMAIYTLYSVLIAKLWRTVGEAWNKGDGGQARTVLLRGLVRAGLFWVTVTVALLPTLAPIIRAFTRGTVQLDDTWFALTATFYVAARSIVDTVTIAIFATRQQHQTLKTVVAHGIVNIPFSILGCVAIGLPGIMLGQLLSLLLTSGWRFPIIFWRTTAPPA